MERTFIGLRPIGPDTEVGNGIYKRKSNNNAERSRAGLFSLKKGRAIITANRFCTICPNLASQIAIFDCEGATRLERYCPACIDANKHLAPSELMANFDNLFIRSHTDLRIFEFLKICDRGSEYPRYSLLNPQR